MELRQGAKVDCATFRSTIENAPPPQVYCIREDGVLAYTSTIDGQILELTRFKSSVNASDLAIPTLAILFRQPIAAREPSPTIGARAAIGISHVFKTCRSIGAQRL